MKNLFFVFLLIIVSPLMSAGQSSNYSSNQTNWEVDFGSGLYLAILTKGDYTGSTFSLGGYHFGMHYQSNGWLISPVVRYMPYYVLIGEDGGTSHNEIGLRGGYLADSESKQFSVLLGASFLFGKAEGSKPNPMPTNLYDDRIYLSKHYRTIGLTSELAWKRKLWDHFLAGISVPISISSWHVIAAPQVSLGYRW